MPVLGHFLIKTACIQATLVRGPWNSRIWILVVNCFSGPIFCDSNEGSFVKFDWKLRKLELFLWSRSERLFLPIFWPLTTCFFMLPILVELSRYTSIWSKILSSHLFLAQIFQDFCLNSYISKRNSGAHFIRKWTENQFKLRFVCRLVPGSQLSVSPIFCPSNNDKSL